MIVCPQEWEFLLLSKLDWDLSAVIAPDFVEHILQVFIIIIIDIFVIMIISLVTFILLMASHPPSLLPADILLPQRLLKLDLAWDIEVTRAKVSTLVCLCYSHPSLSSLPPSLLATSAILTTLRPGLETGMAHFSFLLIAPPLSFFSSSSSSSNLLLEKQNKSPFPSKSPPPSIYLHPISPWPSFSPLTIPLCQEEAS